MKRLLAFVLIILTLFSLTSCDIATAVLNEMDIPFIYIDPNGPGVYEYTDFTDEEKSLFEKHIGSLIPFVPCDKYYVEGYYFEDDYEHGIFYGTKGNTPEEYEEYISQFSDFTHTKSYVDEFGDTFNRYVKDDLVVEISYNFVLTVPYIDVFVYSSLSTDIEGGDHLVSEETLLTNDGKGLPEGEGGVYNVDFTKAEYVKNVSDQLLYTDGCPATSSPAVLVIPVEFKDATAASKGYTIESIENAFCKGGINDYYSVYDFYYTSSYGKLDLDITVLDTWFRPEKMSGYYYRATEEIDGVTIPSGDLLVLNEALDYLDDRMDLSKFDSDGNGTIDAVVLINTLKIADDDFHWAYRYWNCYTDENGEPYKYDGVYANDFLWASYQFLYETVDEDGYSSYDTPAMNTYTYIHEFGHILGADDYYDTEYLEDPMGGYDVMDTMRGDHNAYTKFNLGWITSSRLIVTDSSVTLTLEDFSKNGDTVIIANNWDESLGAYQEYFVLLYYRNKGLNKGEDGYFEEEGVLVYHVNASLCPKTDDGKSGYDVYNNNTASSTRYGTYNTLIEYVKVDEESYVFTVGDTLPEVFDDAGNPLLYTFKVVSANANAVTITFTAR